MAAPDLTGRTISSTYKDLLQVSNSNAGVDGTLRDVEDGEGTASKLQVSTDGVKSTGTLEVTGDTTLTGALSIGGVTLTATGTELNYSDGVTSSIQTQMDLKAPLASPTLTGTPAAPTAVEGTDTTQIATTAFVKSAVEGEDTIAELNDTTISGPTDLDVLQYNGSAWVDRTYDEAGLVSLTGSETLTNKTLTDAAGNTQTALDDSTKLATTAYADAAVAAGGGGAGNLTTKGDLEAYTTTQTRLAVGDDDYVLTADASAASGVAWKEAQGGTTAYYVQRFTGTGSETGFTLSQTPAAANNTQVYISGVYQQKDTYTVVGTTLTFTGGAPGLDSIIEVVIAPTAAIGTTSTDLVTFSPTGTGATDRTTQAKLREVISVKDFGAVGDGSNDDTAEIQAAIDAVVSFGGGMLFFPEGTYKTTDVLTIKTAGYTDSVHFVGSGKVSSIIKQTTSGKGVLEISGRQHSVRDIKLQGVAGDLSAVVLAFGEHTIAVSSITHTGGVATVTTAVAHGYSSATNITIEGSTDTEFNGRFEITVTSTTEFTYVVTSGETSAAGTIKAINANGNDCNNNTVSNVTIKYGADGISMKDCWGIYVTECHISAPSRSCIKIRHAQFNFFENVSMDGVGDDELGLEEASIWYVYDVAGTPNTNRFKGINHNGSRAPIVKFDGVSPTNEIFEEFYDDNAAGFIAYATTADLLNSQKCTFKNIYSNTRLPAYLKTTVDPFYWKKLGLRTVSGDKVTVHTNGLITNDHTTIGNLAANGDYSRMTSSTRVDDWIHWNSAGSGSARELDVAAGAAYTGHAATGSPQSIHLTSSLVGPATYSTFDLRGALEDNVSTSTNNILDVKQTYLISAKVKVISNVGVATKLRAVRAYYDYTAYSANHTHPDVSFTSGWQTLTCLTSGLPANTGTVAGLYLVHDGGASQILIADFKIVEAKPGNIKTAIIHVPATAASDVFELPVFSPNIPVVIMETFIIPSSDITGANTNYMTLEFRSKGTDGTGDTLMSDTAYTSGTNAADWVKYLVGHYATGGGTIGGIIKNGKTDLTADEVVTIKKSVNGTGMVTPAMTVGVTYFIP